MKPHYWQRILSVLLLLGLCLSLVKPASQSYAMQTGREAKLSESLAQTEIQQDAAAKIDPQVLAEINESGQTEFFVWMTEKADLSPAANLKSKLEKGQFVFDTLRDTAERTQKDLRAVLDAQGVEYQAFYIANKILVRSGGEALALELAARPDVAQITPNHKFQLMEPFKNTDIPASPAAIEPNITFIKAPDVWALGVTGSNTVMAGNDTGLDWDHPALIVQYRGWDGATADHNYNWWDATGTYPMVPDDGHGHGTHTTGTMVGDDGGDNQIGVAPGAQTVHCKNMTDGGSGDDGTFSECFEWDLAPWDLTGANPNPALAPDAINNSWGYWGGGANQFEDEIAALQAAGILVEVSAGNEGSSCQTLRSPGDYEEVLTTGSVNHAYPAPGQLTGFSSRGPSGLYPDDYFPDIMAPGENIRSSVPGGGYEGGWSGTSMAGPHATALVGLMWSAAPALRGQVQQTIQIIKDTATPLTDQFGSSCGGDYTEGPNNDWGFGTIDALAAVQLAIAMGGAGNLDGTVTDAITQLPIEDATVRAVHDEGYSWFGSTDATGYYTITVAAGIYEVTASHPQYMSEVVSGVEVITDTVTTQDFELTPRGRLFGYVTDFDNGFPLEATVTADDGTMAYTDPLTGYYEMWLDPGNYEVTASATDYAPESAIVDIYSGDDTQQDFTLMAAVVFIPAPLEKTLEYGSTGTEVATILNRLPDPYNFEFMEGQAGFMPTLLAGEKASGQGEWLYRATTGVPMKNNKGEEVLTYPSAYRWTADSPSQVSVLIYADDPYHGYTSTFLDQALQALGMSYTAHYDGDWYGFISDLQSGTWDMVLVGNDNYADTSVFSPLNDYVLNGGKLIINTWAMSWDTFSPLWSTLGVTWMYDDYDPPDPVYWWDPSHSIFNDPQSVPEFTQLQPYRYGTYGQHVAWTDGFEALAGYTTPGPDPGEAALVLGNEGRTIFKGFLDGQNDADLDFDGWYDGVELWINMISGLEAGFGGGINWFGQDPISGSVPAEDSINATMLFTATAEAGVDQPGVYYLTLTMNGEPGTPDVRVPVNMNVLAPETWGKLEGTITGLGYCDADPAPLEDAEVFIEGSGGMTWTLQTDANGYYQWWLDEAYSPLTVSVSYPDHESGQATGVVIVGQDTTTQNFDLRWLVPCVSADPLELSATLDMGDSATLQLDLANTGAAGTPFEFMEQGGSFDPASSPVSIPRYQGEIPASRAASSTGKPPVAPSPVVSTGAPGIQSPNGAQAYALDVYPGQNLVQIPDVDLPGTWNIVAGVSQFHPGADFLNGDFSKLYAVDYDTNEFVTIDTATGARTVIGYTSPSGSWTGLTGSSDGTLYGMSSICGSDSTLYTIDPATGALTTVGNVGSGTCIIDIAINADGKMYGVDIVSDNLYQIDPATGAGMVIGYTGVDANYAQGMDFEEESGILYWAAYTFNGEMRIIDTNTGNSVAVGGFPGGAEVDGLAFATGGAQDVPWLSEDPVSGYLDADTGQQVVDVTFDAGASGVDQPGEYHASLKVKSDDPVNGSIEVPVTMTVIPPDTWGKLDGVISSKGYCDENPWPIAEAQIVIESSAGVTYTLQSGEDGSYIRWLDEAGSPYSVYVTAPDHVASDPVTVEVVGQQTTTQDISLRWMVPCVSVAPEAYDVEIPQGFTIDYPFSLLNAGAGEAEFSLRDKLGQKAALASIVRSARPSAIQAYSSTDTSAIVRVPSAPSQMLDADVLLIQDWDAWGYPAITSILDANGIAYDLINSSQISTWDFATYKMIIIPSTQSQSYYDQFNNNLAKFEEYIDSGGLLLMSFCTQGETVNIPFGGSNPWDGWDYNYILDPAHPIFTGVDNPYYGNYANHNTLSGLLPDDVVLVTTGMSPGGNPVMIERAQGSGMLVAGGQTFEWGWANGQGAGIILENMIPYYYFNWEPQGDVPWLAQDPIEGMLAADSSYDVELIFTAFPTMPVGSSYTATLIVKSDDLVYDTINVPVTMTVVAPVTALDIDAPVTQQVGEQSTIVTHTITVTNQSNHPDTYDLVVEGYWWATWAPTTVEELWPGESATVEVRVAIPPTVLPGSSDTVVVNAVSQANNAVFESVALTTTAAEHVATFTPDEMALMGIPGHMVTYTLMLENTGNVADTFVMTYTNNTWEVHMVGETSMEMEPGESHEVIIHVMIPEDAVDGDWDMVVIEVHGAPGQVAAAQLTTTAAFPKVYIPVIPQEFAP